MLESALFRPRTGYYETVPAMAAALFESLIMNHPFVDGNKRFAFFGTDVFFRLNGFKLEVETQEAHSFLIGLLESGECNFENLPPWISRSLVRL
jgi:death-on-curing protein